VVPFIHAFTGPLTPFIAFIPVIPMALLIQFI